MSPCDRSLHVGRLAVAQNGGLDSAIREVEAWTFIGQRRSPVVAIPVFELRRGKLYGLRITVGGELIDNGSTGISQSKQLCDFIKSFAGSIIAGMADVHVGPTIVLLLRQIKMSVATGDNQR